MSLARALSKLGFASRSAAQRMVAAGRVTVNSRVVRNPSARVHPTNDRIAVDGLRVKPAGRVYFAFNKPAGVVTTASDERGRTTVYDLLDPSLPRVFPIGRLDRETTGLLLLTNDTRFGDRVTSPDSRVPKTYEVVVHRPFEPEDAGRMARGMKLKDGTLVKPAQVRVDPADPRAFALTIREGKNRQVRRMCEALGYDVVRLHRVSVGPVEIGDLAPGGARPLNAAERRFVQRLRGEARDR